MSDLIELLRQEIERREEELKTLRAALELMSGRSPCPPNQQPPPPPILPAIPSQPVVVPHGQRKDQLVAFLKMMGPTKRVDIVMQTGMPRGTVDTLLKNHELFLLLPNGKWSLRPELIV